MWCIVIRARSRSESGVPSTAEGQMVSGGFYASASHIQPGKEVIGGGFGRAEGHQEEKSIVYV